MRVLACLLAVVLTSLPGVSAAEDLAPVTVVDLFHGITVDDLTFATGCDQVPNSEAQFIAGTDNRSFQFLEGPAPATQMQLQGRSAYVGCGTATYSADIPAGTDHLHVRFTADRVVNAQMPDFTVNFTQQLRVAFDGAAPAVLNYFQAGDFTQPPAQFDPPSIKVPAGARQVTVVWAFQDHGAPNQARIIANFTGLPVPASAQTMNVTVRAPQIEFSGAPLAGVVSHRAKVVQDRQSLQTRVQVTADPAILDAYAVNLRAEVDESLHLVEVITPDGVHLRQFTSNPLAGTIGFRPYSADGAIPLVEPRIDFYRATLPGEAVALHGAGDYVFVFAKDVPLDAPLPLILLAFVVLAMPFLMGIRALYGVQAFRREAFGLYKKSATALLVGVLLALAYYLAFVIQILQQSQHLVMATWPLSSRGLLLYLNVLLAVGALAAFGLVGRRLHDITRPARGA